MLCCLSKTTSHGIRSGFNRRPWNGPRTAPLAIVGPVFTIVLHELRSENSKVTTDKPEKLVKLSKLSEL